MPPDTNTQDEFLKDLAPKENEVDLFDQPLVPEVKPVVQTVPEPEKPEPNRRERRLEAKLQAERESAIALAAKLETLTEAQRLQREAGPSEYVKQIERIYGTNSPEAQEATNLLAAALAGVEQRATEKALNQFREEQRKAAEEARKEEETLDDMVADIEDTFNVTMDQATQKNFFQLLEKLSPKDKQGNIIDYADPHAVWEQLQAMKPAPQTRQKDLASRSMVRTGAQTQTNIEADSQERWLRENGII